MESDSEGLIALARSFEGASVPSTVTLPTLVLEDQQRLEIDGLILLIHQFGPAEAIDSITIEVPANDASFVGDRPFRLRLRTNNRWFDVVDERAPVVRGESRHLFEFRCSECRDFRVRVPWRSRRIFCENRTDSARKA